MTRILATGAAGYIGNVLVRELLERGYSVTVYDTFWFGDECFADIKDQIKIIKDDIRTITSSALTGVDVVIDLAAISNDPSSLLSPELTNSINHIGRVRVARLAKASGVKRYVLPSSVAIYGISKVANETSTVNPLTPYAVANYQCECDVLPLADKDFTVTIARQCTNYGISPKMRYDLLINNFVLQLFKNKKIVIRGNGSEWRPFVHVKDDCRALITILEADPNVVNGEIFNVGSSDQNFTIETLAKKISSALGAEFTYELGTWVDARNYNICCDKITNTLGFKTKYNIIDGAKEIYGALNNGLIKDNPNTITIEWYKKLIKEGTIKINDPSSIDIDWSEKLKKEGVLK
jgi:nucleoside-diphosphate-sugar epimerase